MPDNNIGLWIRFILGREKTGIEAVDKQHDLNYQILATMVENKGYVDLERPVLVARLREHIQEASEDQILAGLQELDSAGGPVFVFGNLPLDGYDSSWLEEVQITR